MNTFSGYKVGPDVGVIEAAGDEGEKRGRVGEVRSTEHHDCTPAIRPTRRHNGLKSGGDEKHERFRWRGKPMHIVQKFQTHDIRL